MRKNGFEGWYFKHQLGNNVVAFIPGIASSGAFVQVISAAGSKHYKISKLTKQRNSIQADRCLFSMRGCSIDLPGIHGKMKYSNLTPLSSDIMGPFQYLPMQCRHGVLSMDHRLSGKINIDGSCICFDGGNGYIEKDSGTSFPRSYQWLQCNAFSQPCSLMISIAHIPFCGTSFTGCICAITYQQHEYRLATYHGVRIHVATEHHITLSQNNLLLDIELSASKQGHALRSPVCGSMSGTIREYHNAMIHARLWENNHLVFDLSSPNATYEYVPDK